VARAAAGGLAALLAAAATASALAAAPRASLPLTVAAYYYPWYGANRLHWDEGYARGQLVPPQSPALGEYDSRDPALIETHYAWAHRYGVDVFLASWSGPHSYNDVTIQEHLLPSPARGPTRIGLLYESIERLGPTVDGRIDVDDAAIDRMRRDFAYLAETAFRDPGYFRIDGRPVVVLYVSRIYVGKVTEAVQAIRDEVLAIDGVEPYLIGDEVDWDMAPEPTRIGLYDAITGYTLYSRTQPTGWPADTGYLTWVGWRLRQFKRAATGAGIPFVPNALPGFDDLGVRPADGHHVLPHELSDSSSDPTELFGAFLRLAGKLVDPGLRLLTVTSWNEWHEDTQIEPTLPSEDDSVDPLQLTQGYAARDYGFGLLDRLAQFKRGWQLAPSQPRKRPTIPAR
jgi:Glycosyl hydrolase family 99